MTRSEGQSRIFALYYGDDMKNDPLGIGKDLDEKIRTGKTLEDLREETGMRIDEMKSFLDNYRANKKKVKDSGSS